MSQKVVYRELVGFAEFEECYRLQKQVFNLPDKDTIPPVFLNLLTRKFPRTGFAIGAFIENEGSEKLIGFILSVAGTGYKSIYCIITGILPEYRKNGIGMGLFIKTKDVAIDHDIDCLYGIYEPLEGNLGNLYLDKFGMVGVKYEPETYELSNEALPIDKMLMKWDFNSERTQKKISKTYKKENLETLLKKHSVVSSSKMCFDDKVLIQIPDDFIKLKSLDFDTALKWRINTRELFTEYINNQNFQITEFYTQKVNEKRENYYLLEKLHSN